MAKRIQSEELDWGVEGLRSLVRFRQKMYDEAKASQETDPVLAVLNREAARLGVMHAEAELAKALYLQGQRHQYLEHRFGTISGGDLACNHSGSCPVND